MIGSTQSICVILPIPLILAFFAGNAAHADQPARGIPTRIEVFTTTDSPVTREAEPTQPDSGVIDLQIYELDGIQRIKTNLSKGLTADPERSRRVVLERIQRMDDAERARMQRAAMGLARALQYGIDRYPAIVFDGEAAIYGVTDVHAALQRYRQWREGRRR